MQLIEDGEVVAITPEGATFYSPDEGIRSRDELLVDWDDESAEKQGDPEARGGKLQPHPQYLALFAGQYF